MTLLAARLPTPRGMMGCFYCGQKIRRHKTWDHVHPIFLGGVDLPANLVVSCKGCNTEKGCLTLEQYRIYKMAEANVASIRSARHGQRPVQYVTEFYFAGE